MQVSVRLAALPIPEYLDFHSGYSVLYSRMYSYSRIFPNERALSFKLIIFSKRRMLRQTLHVWPRGVRNYWQIKPTNNRYRPIL